MAGKIKHKTNLSGGHTRYTDTNLDNAYLIFFCIDSSVHAVTFLVYLCQILNAR